MKISKILIEETKQISEEIEAPSIDPTESVAEIADNIRDQVEIGTEGEDTISDQAASRIAQEVKLVADEVNADEAVVIASDDALGTDNAITRRLDLALQGALRNARRGLKSGNNILIVGLPGSGKTASVYDWARSKGNVNLVYINAKNNDLQAYIDGYTVRRADDPTKVGQAYSDNLADLEKPNSVLFLDEYNRQTKQHIRAALYTLINEHKISGDGPNKTHEFKNLLFTIACINPAVPTDKGAAELNDAELSRFVHKIKNADSDANATIDYLQKQYNLKINKLNSEDSYYLEDLESYLRIQDLGIFIVSHRDFAYDTKDDLEDLAYTQCTMLNQRSLTEGLVVADGRVNAFKDWLNESADFLPKDIEMLNIILSEYVEPSFKALCEAKGIDLDAGKLNISTPEEEPTEEVESEPDAEAEDDEDFFTNSDLGNTSARVKNPREVEDAIKAALKGW